MGGDTKSRFAEDLDRLVERGEFLDFAIQYECDPKGFRKMVSQSIGSEKVGQLLKKLPMFKQDYQAWYSESLALIRQVLPDRLADFKSYFECTRTRKDITFHNYMIRDYLQGLQITRGASLNSEILVDGSAAIPEFRQQLSIVKAARGTLESSLLNLTTILQADLFDSEIESAKALAKAGYFRAAGAVCGVIIEKHLKQICTNHGLKSKKRNPTISDFNQLLKDEDIISVPDWRFIQHLTDIRNVCDHAKGKEPSKQEIDGLLAGTTKVLKTIF